ncbi:MAG TPA: YceH family protein [Opitutaceae bacterium]|nr:YceH family protein [Opitutaceae bacterium]
MSLPFDALSATEARVLGALVEKELTTPDYYPLSLNALVNACNQINNRQPVLALSESEAKAALESLRDKRLAVVVSGGDNRVMKYAHKASDTLALARPALSLVGELLLRGPQTPGELRSRASRMHAFAGLADVVAELGELAGRTPPLVAVLPRQPGSREARYAHLLAGPVETVSLHPPAPAGATAPREDRGSPAASREIDRLAQLEAEVAALKAEVAALKARLGG